MRKKRKTTMGAFCMAAILALPICADAEGASYPEYVASDYVTLGQYKGLSVIERTVSVTEESVEKEVCTAIRQADAMDVITDGRVEDGDIVNIDYVGKVDGEVFDGGSYEGYDLTIGSGTFIDGFEDGLVGTVSGETVNLNLTFPESYLDTELAGADVAFTVTVNEIKRYPELTDAIVTKITDGTYTDADSYRQAIYNDLYAEKLEKQQNQQKEELLEQVEDASEIQDYPQELLDYWLDNMESYYQAYADANEMELEEYLSAVFSLTEKEFEEKALSTIKISLKTEMVLKAIAEKEKIEISEKEYAEGLAAFAAIYGVEEDELVEQYGETEIRNCITQNKVLDYLLENAEITERED